MADKPTIGFIGMGIMGVPMALNLLKDGYKVTVWNRTASKCDPCKEAGASVAPTAAEAVKASDITFAILADPEAAKAVIGGPDGVAAGMSAGKGYVDVSTVDAETAQWIGEQITKAGGAFLEAPVSGSKGPAEQGALIFLCGGDKELYEKSSAALDVMGKAKFFLGPVGKGAEMKLVVNMIMGSMMCAFSEGLSLGTSVGLEAETIVDVIKLGAIAAPMYALKGPLMANGKYDPNFPLKHQQKDMRLALALGDQNAQPMPVAAASNELFKKARAAGYGDDDFCAVLEAVKGSSDKKGL